jgi:hypothetical protein
VSETCSGPASLIKLAELPPLGSDIDSPFDDRDGRRVDDDATDDAEEYEGDKDSTLESSVSRAESESGSYPLSDILPFVVSLATLPLPMLMLPLLSLCPNESTGFRVLGKSSEAVTLALYIGLDVVARSLGVRHLPDNDRTHFLLLEITNTDLALGSRFSTRSFSCRAISSRCKSITLDLSCSTFTKSSQRILNNGLCLMVSIG